MKFLITAVWMLVTTLSLLSQESDSTFTLTAFIYDEAYKPVPATHVINMNTHAGDVSDSLGIFTLPVHAGDTLLFRNIAYRETVLPVAVITSGRYVILKKVYYPLQEARVFPWGSTYGDFSKAIINTPAPQTLGESLGLPRQDPNYIPFDMDESKLKSTGFLLTSPIYYLYYNLSRREKNRRKLYWSGKNKEKNEIFEEIVSPESISNITGLTGDPLLEFLAYLFQRLVCDFKCTELNVYSEIYSHWEVYQQLH
ncbi:MAG: hypothetical protein GY790_18600 [Bacteroidetes bacterium]|nr:hypothetical protein [Bacteroidota bacterium]